MTGSQLEEALGLTAGGVGAAFLVMALLMVVVLGTAWVLGRPFVRRMTGPIKSDEASATGRKRALAAAIAVSVALADSDAGGNGDAREAAQS